MTRAMMTTDVDEMNRVLSELGPIHMWFRSYRDTFSMLHVMLGADGRSAKASLFFRDCVRIDGPTSGGPWTFRLEEAVVEGQPGVILRADGLCVHALAVACRAGPPTLDDATGDDDDDDGPVDPTVRDTMTELLTSHTLGLRVVRAAGRVIVADAAAALRMVGVQQTDLPVHLLRYTMPREMNLAGKARRALLAYRKIVVAGAPAGAAQDQLEKTLDELRAELDTFWM